MHNKFVNFVHSIVSDDIRDGRKESNIVSREQRDLVDQHSYTRITILVRERDWKEREEKKMSRGRKDNDGEEGRRKRRNKRSDFNHLFPSRSFEHRLIFYLNMRFKKNFHEILNIVGKMWRRILINCLKKIRYNLYKIRFW